MFQHKNLAEIKQILRETQLEESRKRELSSALHVQFKDWLYGNYCYSESFGAFHSNCMWGYTGDFMFQELIHVPSLLAEVRRLSRHLV